MLHAALRLFAEKGYAGASIREIAKAAGGNVACISYYFGDKAGLYRAAFREPMGAPLADNIELYDQPYFTLRQSLEGFVGVFLAPVAQGEAGHLSMRLRFREMIEPTGLWAEEVEAFKPAYRALVRVLIRHLGLEQPDDDVYRLAFAIIGLCVHQLTYHDAITAIQPGLTETPEALLAWGRRTVDFAEAMVMHEAARRRSVCGS